MNLDLSNFDHWSEKGMHNFTKQEEPQKMPILQQDKVQEGGSDCGSMALPQDPRLPGPKQTPKVKEDKTPHVAKWSTASFVAPVLEGQ